MGKIVNVGNQWIEIYGSAMNLSVFKEVTKGHFGMDEDLDGDEYFIQVIERDLIEGEEKKYIIATYKDSEKGIWEEDFQTILKALGSPKE